VSDEMKGYQPQYIETEFKNGIEGIKYITKNIPKQK
jgi:hypothetical protein